MGRRLGRKRQCIFLYLRKMRNLSELEFFVKNYLENRSRFSRKHPLKCINIFAQIILPILYFQFQCQFYGYLGNNFFLPFFYMLTMYSGILDDLLWITVIFVSFFLHFFKEFRSMHSSIAIRRGPISISPRRYNGPNRKSEKSTRYVSERT